MSASTAQCEVVLPCGDTFDETLKCFCEELKLFQIEEIYPADAPTVARLTGSGLRVRLTRDGAGEEKPGRAITLCVQVEDKRALTARSGNMEAPNGTQLSVFEYVKDSAYTSLTGSKRSSPPVVDLPALPQDAKIEIRRSSEGGLGIGRASMQYRDLVPGRFGGAFIASSIHVAAGGEVPDYCHYHVVHFQLIYVVSGWARLVYEGQGPPFYLHPGEFVIQPPTIRHQVLETSGGLEVMELALPAVHSTRIDRTQPSPVDMTRSSDDAEHPGFRPENANHKICGGQQFYCFRPALESASWGAMQDYSGFEKLQTGVLQATQGVADVSLVRRTEAGQTGVASTVVLEHEWPLSFYRVNSGSLVLETEAESVTLQAGDTVALPQSSKGKITSASVEAEWLQIQIRKY